MAFCGLPFPLMNCIKPSSNKNGSQVKIRFSFILETVEFAVEEEEEEEVATRLAMQEIMKKVEGLTEKIKEVGETAAKCSKLVALERLLVLEHILGLPIN